MPFLALMVTACGSPSSEGDHGPALASAQPLQTTDALGTPYVAITDEDLGWRADVPDTSTARLQVMDDFTFNTSHRTTVEMWVPEAVNVSAEATFCTDYQLIEGGGYEVNYNSCVLQVPLENGALNEELNLVNEHQSVLGIVWFQDQALQPVYQEFHFNQ